MDAIAEDAAAAASPLALIERLDAQGRVQHSTLVRRWPVRMGRSFEADLVLDDPHLAPLHAELDVAEGAVRLTVRESINGAVVDGHAVRAGQSCVLPASRTWRMGTSTYRVRLADDALAPELPLGRQTALRAKEPALPTWFKLLPMLLLFVLAQVFDRWLDANPGTDASTHVGVALAALLLALGWALFWSLGSKLFLGRLDFKAHLHLALLYSLSWYALAAALPLLGYAMDWPVLSRITSWVTIGVASALVWAHLAWIMPAHRRGLMVAMVALYAVVLGLPMLLSHQRTGVYLNDRYAAALPPPAWRLVGTQPVSVLLEDARGMKAALDRQARDDKNDEPSDVSFD